LKFTKKYVLHGVNASISREGFKSYVGCSVQNGQLSKLSSD